jgi:hypothetical protein
MPIELEAKTLSLETEDIDCWAYVEIFGHSQLAGRVTTRKLGTQIMFQVDVPTGENELSHSELFNPSSIFSIKPTTEVWCRKFAAYREKHAFHEVLPYIPKERQLPPTEEEHESAEDTPE